MLRSLAFLASAVPALVLSTAAAASPTSQTAPAPAAAERVEAAPPAAAAPAVREFRPGPIHATDPAVREEIRALYRAVFDAEQAAQVRLTELAQASRESADPAQRVELARQMIAVKQDVHVVSVEWGLEIARLNGDEARVADFEKALDQIRHPENYRSDVLDPSIAKERARRAGLE